MNSSTILACRDIYNNRAITTQSKADFSQNYAELNLAGFKLLKIRDSIKCGLGAPFIKGVKNCFCCYGDFFIYILQEFACILKDLSLIPIVFKQLCCMYKAIAGNSGSVLYVFFFYIAHF